MDAQRFETVAKPLVKDHIDEFINASLDEHKTCFTKTIQKMFGMSKGVVQREAEAKHIESALPLQMALTDQYAFPSAETCGNGCSNSKTK